MTWSFAKALLLSSLLLVNQPAQAFSSHGWSVSLSLAGENGNELASQLRQQGLRVEILPHGATARCELSADWPALQRAMTLLDAYARRHHLPLPSPQVSTGRCDEAISSRPVGLDASAAPLPLCLNDEPSRLDVAARWAVENLPEPPPVRSAGPAARAVRGPPCC
jgi:hypothetical protein